MIAIGEMYHISFKWKTHGAYSRTGEAHCLLKITEVSEKNLFHYLRL